MIFGSDGKSFKCPGTRCRICPCIVVETARERQMLRMGRGKSFAPSLLADEQLRGGQHRGFSPVLPAATHAAHAARTGRAPLSARAADGDDFGGVCGALRRCSVRAVSGRVRVVRCGELCARRRSLRGMHRGVQSPSFDDERGCGGTHRATADEACADERGARGERPYQAAPAKSLIAPRAKAATRPHAPTQTSNPLAAFRTKVWPVHLWEISFTCEDALLLPL